MATTAQDHIDDFLIMYPGCSPALALRWLNQINVEIGAHIPLQRDRAYMGLTEGVWELPLDELILRIWKVVLYTDATSFHTLDETDEEKLDIDYPDHEARGPGDPGRWYVTADEDGGALGINPIPDVSTLRVTGATVASPCVVTFDRDHGWSDGDRVLLVDIGGTTTANGLFYAKTTGLAANQISLYEDEALSTAVAGVGAYTAGGLAAGNSSPLLMLRYSTRTALVAGSPMPTGPKIDQLYSDGMAMLWTKLKKPADFPAREKIFYDQLNKQAHMKMTVAAHKTVDITPFRQRANWRTKGIRR